MKKILSVILLSLFLIGCEEGLGTNGSDPDPNVYEVIYEVTGDANSVSIILFNIEEKTEQYSSISLPYTYSFNTVDYCNFMYIRAENNNSSGSVITKIYIDGKLREFSISSGAYVISTASGIVSQSQCYY